MTIQTNKKSTITPAMRNWCKSLANGSQLQQSAKSNVGPYTVNSTTGVITYVMVRRLENAGLLLWERSLLDPDLKVAKLTPCGEKLARPAVPRLSAKASNDTLRLEYKGTLCEGLPYLFRAEYDDTRREAMLRDMIEHHVSALQDSELLWQAIDAVHALASVQTPAEAWQLRRSLYELARLLPSQPAIDRGEPA
jgi:hypothetical protein